ncbi:hypothetical protein RhiirA5_383232 [Rhizophagus irregularis]|uniref:Transmembrane protein n=1 Tax=Rhizophagus irregularis TaxID=588596 RepID=A0A2N0NXT1_9GLOM|nr:hypothetical protein RhiirA5_383232 [Rhizophagus irregularis]
MALRQYFYRRNAKTVINSRISIFVSSLVSALWQLQRFRISDPGSFAFQLFGSKHFSSSAQRSRFFSILALQFEGPGSFFENFGALVFNSTFRVLRSQFFLWLLQCFGISVLHTVGFFSFFVFFFIF